MLFQTQNALHAASPIAKIGFGARTAAIVASVMIGANLLSAQATPKRVPEANPSGASSTSDDSQIRNDVGGERGPTMSAIPDNTSCDQIKSGVEGKLDVIVGVARLEVRCDDRVFARCGPVGEGKSCVSTKTSPPKTGRLHCDAITEKKAYVAQAECLDP